KLDIFASARLFALLNMALADAYIAGWDAKLHYNFWRPYTAIQFADTDNNAATDLDTSWESQEPTPPIHDYPSTHSALGNAGASVLAGLLGDHTPFTMTSTSSEPTGAPRSFKSFSQAADENADSRVMAGLHFRFSCEAGQELGNKIGQWTLQNYLKPRNR
ncbi:MAG TPA: vanadium-dependent haloperoxidase, partial [Chitinophagaceae bacterium]